MKLTELTLKEYLKALRSDAPAPGGGSVSALAGVQGISLLEMVADLTIGKEKYKEYEAECIAVKGKCKSLYDLLLAAVDKDTEAYLAVSSAFRLPKETEEEKAFKAETLEAALKVACGVPVDIVRVSFEAIKLHEELAEKGSKLALSDVGVGVQLLRSALIGGWLNVVININMIKDTEYVANIRKELVPLVENGVKICDNVYEKVLKTLEK